LSFAPAEGFAVSTITYAAAGATAGNWFAIPFSYNGKNVTGVTFGGIAATSANFRTTLSASNQIEFNFASVTGARTVVVTLTGGAQHTINFNPA
jgi:hypothetical protein